MFESAPGLQLALLPNLTIVAVSNAYLSPTKTKREDILGRNVFDVLPDNPDEPTDNETQDLRSSLERVLQNRATDAMPVHKSDIGRVETQGGRFEDRYWIPTNSPVIGASGEVAYIIHHIEDVTEFARPIRQSAELEKLVEELQIRAGQMETEIFRRGEELQEANRKLQAANEAIESANPAEVSS